jgi:hypothetical protein
MDGDGGGAVAHNISKCIYLYLNLMMLSAAQNLQHQIMNDDCTHTRKKVVRIYFKMLHQG